MVLISGAVHAKANDLRSPVDALVKPFLKGKKNIGLMVGIVTSDSQQVFGYGKVKLAAGEQVPDGNTVFEIGSLTKVFTGILLADLVRSQVVHLDDPARKYLPDDLQLFDQGGKPITLLHLATHTSGLPVEPPLLGRIAQLNGDPASPYGKFSRARLSKCLEAIKLLEVQQAAGAEYEYSNLGSGLLGHALAHAAKADRYEDLLRKRITEPLGMKDTGIRLTESQRARFAPAHDDEGNPIPHWDFETLEACGALRSTAHDLLRFAAANLGKPATPLLAAMRDSHKPRRTAHAPDRIGLGWHSFPLLGGSGACTWHNGGTYGARSYLGLLVEKGIAVVVLCNGNHPVDDLALAILKRLATGDSARKPKP
jgi:CubicO group peptidase (beta-lactamase class C family)